MLELLIKAAIAVFSAYLIGSISPAYLVGRLAKGIDMREVGDSHIGTMYAIRRLGRGWGILVALMDFSKGVAAVGLAKALGAPLVVILLAGLAVVVGHNWSIFIGFQGGRGAAAAYGVLGALVPWHLIIALIIIGLFHYLTRNSTLVPGVPRSTVLFGAALILLSILIWADATLDMLGMLPWVPKVSRLLSLLPPCILAVNLLKHPRRPRTPE